MVLGTVLSWPFSRSGRAAEWHCLPRSLQTKPGKGLGLCVEKETVFPPLVLTSFPLLLSLGAEIEIYGGEASGPTQTR